VRILTLGRHFVLSLGYYLEALNVYVVSLRFLCTQVFADFQMAETIISGLEGIDEDVSSKLKAGPHSHTRYTCLWVFAFINGALPLYGCYIARRNAISGPLPLVHFRSCVDKFHALRNIFWSPVINISATTT